MVRPLPKIFAVALCTATLGGLMLVPSVSAASDLGGKFQIKATNSAQSQFWAIRGYHAPGQGDSGGSNPGGDTGTTDPGDGSGGTGTGDPGAGSGTPGNGGGSDPSDPAQTGSPGVSRSNTTAGYWSGMTYGAGKYLAVSYIGNQTLSSTDEGKSWKAEDLPSGNWDGVAYGAGKFVAVSQPEDYDPTTGGNIATSTDGVSWSSKRTPGYGYQSVVYGNGLFVAAGDSTRGPAILTSPDGSNWTEQSLPSKITDGNTSSRIMGMVRVQFIDGMFYASTALGIDAADGTYSRSALLIRSSDGKNWSATDALPGTTDGWKQSTSGYATYSRDMLVKTSSGLIQSAIELGGEGGTSFFRSTDGGKSWSKFTPTGLPSAITPQFSVGSTTFAYSPTDTGVQLYSSTDGGNSWKQTSDGSFEGAFGFRNEFANSSHGNCTVAIPMTSDSAFRACS